MFTEHNTVAISAATLRDALIQQIQQSCCVHETVQLQSSKLLW